MATNEEEKKDAGTKRVVPKFASFKAPVAVVKREEGEKASKDREREKERDRERGRESSRRHHRKSRSRSRSPRRDRDRDRDRERDRDRDRDRHTRSSKLSTSHKARRHSRSTSPERKRRRRSPTPEKKRLPSPPRKPSPKPHKPPTHLTVREEDQKLYKIDLRGDLQNLQYGSSNKYSVPLFYRTGYGSVLGIRKELRIDREKENEEKGIELRETWRRGSRGRIYNELRAVEGGRKIKLLMVGEEGDEGMRDFVALSKKPRKVEEEGGEGESGVFGFRQLKDVKNGEKEVEEVDEDEFDELSIYSNDAIRQKTIALNRAIDANPEDPEGWLALVRHQDDILHSERAGMGRRATLEEKHSAREIKMDILEKAVRKCGGSEEVWGVYMEVGGEMWDSAQTLEKWNEILTRYPNKLKLWVKYLNFRQSDFASFTVPEVKKAFGQCLEVLKEAKWRSGVERWSEEESEKLEKVMVHVLMRGVRVLQEAGFVENAIAILQALIEVNFRRPSAIPIPSTVFSQSSLLASFQEFWDSEVPRAGEASAKGWASYYSDPEDNDADLKSPVETEQDFDPEDPFGSWIDTEEELCPAWRMPARTTDAVEDEDPFRVVLWDDVKDWVVCLEMESVREELVDGVLVLMGLGPCHPRSSDDALFQDEFLRNDDTLEKARYEKFWPEDRPETKAIEWTISAPEVPPPSDVPLGFPLPAYPTSLSTQLPSSSWFSDFISLPSLTPAELEFRTNLLRFISETSTDEDFLMFFLAFTFKYQPEGVKKTARALLKKHKTSIKIWAAYARIEALQGNTKQAEVVFGTAVGLAGEVSIGTNSVFYAAPVWCTWVEGEFEKGNYEGVKGLICDIEGGKFTGGEVTPVKMVRIRRFLEEQESLAISLSQKTAARHLNHLRTILEYLSRDHDIQPLVHVPDSLINELQSRKNLDPLTQEQILIQKIKLLHHHISNTKLVPLKTFRQALEDAIKAFPRNTIFTSLYLHNEARSRIDNRVRDLFSRHVIPPGKETALGYLYAIWAELRLANGTDGGYNVHAVRELFERAVESKVGGRCVDLWRLYIEFELKQREYRRAKVVWGRAVKGCAWSKGLALVAFRELRSAMEAEDLRKIFSMMTSEKELRCHESSEMDEWIERYDRANAGRMQRRVLGRHREDDLVDLMRDG